MDRRKQVCGLRHPPPRTPVPGGPVEQMIAESVDFAFEDMNERIWTEAKLKADGLRATRLSVATAFHSKVVSASTVPFKEFLGGIEFSAPGASANLTHFRHVEDELFRNQPDAMAFGQRMAPGISKAGIIFFTYFKVKSTIFDFGNGSMSPTRVVITCLTEVPSIDSAATAPKLSSTIRTVEPESFN